MFKFQIEAQAVQEKARYEKFVKDSNERIYNIEKEQMKWEALMPIQEMNCEEALAAGLTEYVVDVKNPRYWPHDVDQADWDKYIAKLKKEAAESGGDH